MATKDADENVSYEDLMADEWNPMTTDKVIEIRAGLQDWKRNREEAGYDVRLVEGAIAVCDAYIRLASPPAAVVVREGEGGPMPEPTRNQDP